MSSRFSSLVHLTCLTLFIMVLSACSRDPDEPEEIPEINSLNIFFEETVSGGIVEGTVWSIDYDKGDGLPKPRDTYSPGENMAIALNTDAEKQGLEYAVYAQNFEQGNKVMLLDYDKAIENRTETLQEFQATICGVHKRIISNPEAFDKDSDFALTALDDNAVIVSVNDDTCDNETNQQYRIRFKRNNFDEFEITERRSVSSSELYGVHFFDPTFVQPTEDDTNNEDEDENNNLTESIPPGEGLWIGYDNVGNSLRLRTDEGVILAETAFSSIHTPTFTVIGDRTIVIQADSDIYIIRQEDLRLVASGATNSPDGLAPENNFAKIVESSNLTLSDDSENPALIEHNSIDFIIDDAGSLRLFRDNKFKLIEDLSSLSDYRFGLSQRGLTYIVSDFETHKSLITRFNPDVSDSNTLIASADDIDFRIIGNDVLVNSINSEHYPGWRSTKIDANNDEDFVNNAAFLFTYDSDEQKDKAYILYSESPSAETLINPGVYVYDPEAENGLGFLREGEQVSDDDEGTEEEAPSNDDGEVIEPLPENPDIKEKVLKRYGFLGADLVELPSSILGVNFEVNDKFAGFSVVTATDSSPASYFFEPDFVEVADEIEEAEESNVVGSTSPDEIIKVPNPLGSAAQPSKAFQE